MTDEQETRFAAWYVLAILLAAAGALMIWRAGLPC